MTIPPENTTPHNMVDSLHPSSITVLMPVYNGAKYLREAIESILTQTFLDFEFLIIDDGSTDDSAAIVTGYTDPRIRLLRNETNLGLPATLNKGLEMIQSPLIARMDADDISLPTRLEKQVAYLQAHPQISILGCNHRLISSAGKPGDLSDFALEHGLIRWRLIFGSPMAHPCVMMHTDVLRQFGGYQPLTVAQDYDLWQRSAWQTRLANLPDVLLHLRFHYASSSRSKQELVDTNSNRICTTAMTRMLGTPPPADLVGPIRTWAFASPAEARHAATLIHRLCQANQTDPGLTPREKRLIRTDAAKWLLHLVRQQRTWPALPLALQLDPLIPLRLPFLALRLLIRKYFIAA